MDWGGAEGCTDVVETGILYPGKFVRMFFLTIPPDWAGVHHDATYTCTIDSSEEALM